MQPVRPGAQPAPQVQPQATQQPASDRTEQILKVVAVALAVIGAISVVAGLCLLPVAPIGSIIGLSIGCTALLVSACVAGTFGAPTWNHYHFGHRRPFFGPRPVVVVPSPVFGPRVVVVPGRHHHWGRW